MDLRALYHAIPLFTRSLMVASTAAFVLAPFFPATLDALACAPYHVLLRLQLWRLLTAALCPDTLLSTLLGLFLLYRHGPTLEQAREGVHGSPGYRTRYNTIAARGGHSLVRLKPDIARREHRSAARWVSRTAVWSRWWR
jgi:hypothetical protein